MADKQPSLHDCLGDFRAAAAEGFAADEKIELALLANLPRGLTIFTGDVENASDLVRPLIAQGLREVVLIAETLGCPATPEAVAYVARHGLADCPGVRRVALVAYSSPRLEEIWLAEIEENAAARHLGSWRQAPPLPRHLVGRVPGSFQHLWAAGNAANN